MTNVFKYFTQCLSTHWFKGNSYILSGPEIKSHITQVSLTCVSVLTMIAFKNRCNVSALAPTDWLLQPDQVLWHCEDRHHDLWGDWVLRKRFSAGKEFCRSPSTLKLSNFKVRKKIPISVFGPHAAAMDWASGGRFLTPSSLPLDSFSPAFPRRCCGCHQLDGSQQPEDEVRCKQGNVQAELCPGNNSQYLYCAPYWEHIGYNFFFIFQAVAVFSADAVVDPTVPPSDCERIEKIIYSILIRDKQYKAGIWQILCCKEQQAFISVYKKKW